MEALGFFILWIKLMILSLVSIAFGYSLLERFRLVLPSKLVSILVSAGLGFGFLILSVFGLGIVGCLSRPFVIGLLVIMAFIAGRGWWYCLTAITSVQKALFDIVRGQWLRGILVICISGFLLLDALMAYAPLTGSDAMNYHFTVPRLWVEARRFFPIFGNVCSIYTGSGHLLITLGLLLGDDRFALGLVYLGGVLTLGALLALGRSFLSLEGTLWVLCVFLITPMVYWQISTSGCPDIWMAFFTTMTLVVTFEMMAQKQWRYGVLAGFFAGMTASFKYVAWSVPLIFCLLLSFYREVRPFALLLGGVSLIFGAFPQVRNLCWSGDPFFPFLGDFMKVTSNNYLLSSLSQDNHAPLYQVSLKSFFDYPFLMVLQGQNFGVGHYFGPLILTFSPLIGLLWKKGIPHRVAVAFLGLFFLSNYLTTQLARYLIPVFPLALVLAMAGIEEVRCRGFRVITIGCWGTLLLFFVFGVGSNLLYAKDFLPVVLGREKKEDFLSRMAPDYNIVHFVNRALRDRPGKTMVFFRHHYYLRVPFINGDPRSSWYMDPKKYNTAENLHRLLQSLNVKYIVKAPNYPEPLAQGFTELEGRGVLLPIAQETVENFSGWRIYGSRTRIKVTLLAVKNGPFP